jgi:four helix bundle protein
MRAEQSPKNQIAKPKKIPNRKISKTVCYSESDDAWDDNKIGSMLKEEPPRVTHGGRPYDLEERTAQFGEAIVRLSKKVPRNPTNDRLIRQLVGCGTSVGANYHEANEPMSKKDFICCIRRCLKEGKETKFFLRMIVTAESSLAAEARLLYREVKELILIFSSMCK